MAIQYTKRSKNIAEASETVVRKTVLNYDVLLRRKSQLEAELATISAQLGELDKIGVASAKAEAVVDEP